MEQGYYTSFGHKGLVDGAYMLFATETEYQEYLEEHEEKDI